MLEFFLSLKIFKHILYALNIEQGIRYLVFTITGVRATVGMLYLSNAIYHEILHDVLPCQIELIQL